MKVTNDQFYTNPKVCDKLIKIILDMFAIEQEKKYYFLEPSAGSGNFIDSLYKNNICVSKNVLSFDIDPKSNESILKKDFLSEDLKKYHLNKKHTISIGNPPFGKKGLLAVKFLNKCLDYSNIVCFILPKTFRRYSVQQLIKSTSELVYDIDLEDNSFLVNDREYSVKCCFQIWINSEVPTYLSNLRIKKPLERKLEGLELFIHNNTEKTMKYFDKKKYQWDFAVHRQGYYDYSKKIINPKELVSNQQYLFIKINNSEIKRLIDIVDFKKLSKSNTTIPGFSNTDLAQEIHKIRMTEQISKLEFWESNSE